VGGASSGFLSEKYSCFLFRASPFSDPYQLQRQLLIGGPERFGGVAGNRLVKLTFEAI
jgi:hypothetical protein